jgi:hypothetical protein
MHVPNHQPRAKVIRTLVDYRDAGIQLISHCGAGCGRSHLLDLAELIREHGPEAEPDYAFRRSLTCPTCGGPGGGLEVRPRP